VERTRQSIPKHTSDVKQAQTRVCERPPLLNEIVSADREDGVLVPDAADWSAGRADRGAFIDITAGSGARLYPPDGRRVEICGSRFGDRW